MLETALTDIPFGHFSSTGGAAVASLPLSCAEGIVTKGCERLGGAAPEMSAADLLPLPRCLTAGHIWADPD